MKPFAAILPRLSAAMLIAAAAMLHSPAISAIELPDEDLKYSVMYKWGPVNKQAAEAILSLRSDGAHYRSQLAARTMPWADKVYRVRDTLQSSMVRKGCLPTRYAKLTHEGNHYRKDVLTYSRAGGMVTVDATREKRLKNGTMAVSDTILEATSPGYDMLSVFYYLRLLDFSAMTPGQQTRVHIFSGRSVENLAITYKGTHKVKIKGRQWDTYYVTFSFTHKDGTQSSAPMYAWISTDPSRIPLKLEGELPLGKVQAIYEGATPVQK